VPKGRAVPLRRAAFSAFSSSSDLTRTIPTVHSSIATQLSHDLGQGSAPLPLKIQKGEDIPDDHLRAFRMAKEEILYCWLKYTRSVVQNYFIMQDQPISEETLFQNRFPDPLWLNIQNFIRNLGKLPLWVNREMSLTVFGGKSNYSVWEAIFQTGSSPQGQKVLTEPINTLKLIRS
jgi:hypothetical protein